MLQNANRIKKRKEFGYIYKNGDTVFSKNFTMLYTSNKFKLVRIGISVSKKVGKAYMRNKIKRQIRAVCRLNLNEFPINHNYVIIPKATVVDLTYKEMEKEILSLVGKVSKGLSN